MTLASEVIHTCRMFPNKKVQRIERLFEMNGVGDDDISKLERQLKDMCAHREDMVRNRNVPQDVLKVLNFEIAALSLAIGLYELKKQNK